MQTDSSLKLNTDTNGSSNSSHTNEINLTNDTGAVPSAKSGDTSSGESEITFAHRHFYNRELSWLKFNYRVLQEGMRKSNPLLERLKFLAIVANNLDEFFEIRVAMLEQKLASNLNSASAPDKLTSSQVLTRIYRLVGKLLQDLYHSWNEDILKSLAEENYAIINHREFTPKQREFVDKYFEDKLYPVLTPIKIDSAHPFPWVINKALCIAALLKHDDDDDFQLGVITIPRVLPRVLKLPADGGNMKAFTFVTEIVEANMDKMFKGYQILGQAPFRITRNSNLYFDEEEESNLLKAVENELANRRKGDAVRMEIHKDAPELLISDLRRFFKLRPEQTNKVNGPVNFNRVMALYKMIDRTDLKEHSFVPAKPEWYKNNENIFNRIRERDILLHHPYESFAPVLHLLKKASVDPAVLAIKITLYRTGDESPIIKSLIAAASNGKEVTVVLELMARFDEQSNVTWAKHLLDHGVHVVYGLLGYKTHSKLMLIVREEDDKLVKYMHIGTGNYNESTARLYTDLSLFTCKENISRDILEIFTVLTSQSRKPSFDSLMVSPFNMIQKFLEKIENEIQAVKEGREGRIIFKVNSLQDETIIKALYRASIAGVKIIGIVRGICCLKPGRKGYSENISIRSIVGRFLEHARIFYFENSRPHRLFIGSADWMPRNLRRRVEVITPIQDKDIENRILNEVLELQLQDTHDARVSGKFWKLPTDEELADDANGFFSSQQEFMRLAELVGE